MGAEGVDLIRGNKLVVVLLDELGNRPFPGRSLLLDRHLGLTADPGDGALALGPVVRGGGELTAEALAGADDLAADDGAVAAGALVDADAGAKAHAPCVRVVENAGGLLGVEFHSLVGLEIGVGTATGGGVIGGASPSGGRGRRRALPLQHH